MPGAAAQNKIKEIRRSLVRHGAGGGKPYSTPLAAGNHFGQPAF
jgi:hypothetical protein